MKTNNSVSRFIDSVRNEQSNYIIALIIICVLALLLIYSIVMNGYEITSLVVTSKEETQKVERLNNSSQAANPLINTMHPSRWDYFGSAEASAGPSNYSLLGIEYTAGDPADAKAIISANSGDAELYSVGDKLGPGTIVDRIEQNSVIVLHNGVRQTLSLIWDGETDMNKPLPPENLSSPPPSYRSMMEQIKRFKMNGGEFPIRKYEQ